ncbi:hypothetical protein GCM10009771_11190 [Nesterenkonia flava]
MSLPRSAADPYDKFREILQFSLPIGTETAYRRKASRPREALLTAVARTRLWRGHSQCGTVRITAAESLGRFVLDLLAVVVQRSQQLPDSMMAL